MPRAPSPESRRTRRVPLVTRIAYYGPSRQGHRGTRLHTAEGVDISQGGLCIRTTIRLSISQIIRLGLPVCGAPVGTSITTPTLAECRWVELRHGQYRAGLRFLL